MELIFGTDDASLLALLQANAKERYQPQSVHVFGKYLGFLSSDDQGIVGQASDPDQGINLLLLGVLNLNGRSLAQSSANDAQFALNQFKSKGVDGLVCLNGQFVIAVADEQNDSLFIIPDSNGLRSVYYINDSDTFAFASNLSTLASSLKREIDINQENQNFFLSFGFFPHQQTVFKNVYRLPGTHFLSCCKKKLTLASKSESLDSQPSPKQNFSSMNEDKLCDLLDNTFREAVREQLSPDHKVGVLLGGFDSALVAAYLAQEGKEVHTYSFGYENRNYNQTYTELVTADTGCIHHWVPMNAEIIKQGLTRFADYFNAPTNWLNYPIQTEFVCREMKKNGIRHAYSGDGCDSIFLGYPNVHKTSVVFDRFGIWPDWLVGTVIRMLDSGFFDRMMGRPYAVCMHLLRSLRRKMPQRGLLTFQIMDESTVGRIQGRAFEPAPSSNEEILEEVAKPYAGKSIDRIAYAGKGLLSPNLSKMIGSSDSTAVVIQAPYLHHKLKSLAASLPDHLCRPKGETKTKVTGKYILMRMAEKKRLLSPTVIYQKKISAVDAPLDEWLKNDLKEFCESCLADLPFEMCKKYQVSLLETKLIEEFHRRFISSDSLTTHALSHLLTYSRFTRFL